MILLDSGSREIVLVHRKPERKWARKWAHMFILANNVDFSVVLAERVGFEPTVRLPVRRISSAVLSTTQPPLRICMKALAGRSRLGGGASSSAFRHCIAALWNRARSLD